jgi:hypothetical protein
MKSLGAYRLTSVDNDITTSHPRGVSLRAHQHCEITNLLGLGESYQVSLTAVHSAERPTTHRSKGVNSCHFRAYALDLSSVCEVVISVATYLGYQLILGLLAVFTYPGEIQLTEIP